ncbi:MAG: histidinol-phosphate transaminase [Clostridia bacterium]|nr:histidinol-phosphate transaminase [Clostridia bacterium]
MSKYWSNIAKGVEPYVPGEQPKDKKYIKLNTNESPYPPSPKVLEAIKRAANEDLRLYPDPNCDELRQTIAQYYDLKKEQVFVGNGSDEVLAFSYMAFFNPGSTIFFPDISYSFYPVYSELFKVNYKLVPLDEEFDIPLDKFFDKNGGIIISNPNAPTAKALSVESIEIILSQNEDSVVIVDEAYIDFGEESAVKLINTYPNLLVIQTLSKSRSLAGLRVGFALGSRELIEGLDRIKNSVNSYTLDRLALAGAVEAIKDEAYFQETRTRVINTRERVTAALKEMSFNVTDSKANFVFISHPKVQAECLFRQLREKGILVRYFNKPRIDNFLRVSIGSDEEMDCFLEAIREIISR